MERIGVRELRQHASRWLARVGAGETFEITDRGRPVAVLSPVPTGGAWDRLVQQGELTGTAGDAADVPAVPVDGPTASQVLADLRADER